MVWSGLSVREARTAWNLASTDLADVYVTGQPAWILAECSGSTRESAGQTQIVRLLPHFDAYLLGYRNRDLVVAPRYNRRVQRGGGWLRQVVIVNGWVVATWSYNDKGKRQNVIVEPLEELDSAIAPRLRSEVDDIGRFVATSPALAISPPR